MVRGPAGLESAETALNAGWDEASRCWGEGRFHAAGPGVPPEQDDWRLKAAVEELVWSRVVSRVGAEVLVRPGGWFHEEPALA